MGKFARFFWGFWLDEIQLIAISSMFNGFGRLFWGGLSDRIGRTRVFRIILGSQVLVFVALLTAWSAGGIVGPQIVAFIKDRWASEGATTTAVAAANAGAAGAKVTTAATAAAGKVAQVAGVAMGKVAGGAATAAQAASTAAAAGAGVAAGAAAGRAAMAAGAVAAGPAAMAAASWTFVIGAALLALGFGLSFLLSDGKRFKKGV
jgi:hypothetical protein